MNRFSIIGSGNVATWIARRISSSGAKIDDVYGRSMEKAVALARQINARPIDDLRLLNPESDLYVFAVADDAYESLLETIPFLLPCAIHTAGSVSISIFKQKAIRYGTIYPYQTISKGMDLDTVNVPLCVEGDSLETGAMLQNVAMQWSDLVYQIREEQRKWLHLAAVFSSNFANLLYDIGYEILENNGIDPKIVFPLWENTLTKAQLLTPRKSQTGPAIRNDKQTIDRHLAMITDAQRKELYELCTAMIQKDRTGEQVDK